MCATFEYFVKNFMPSTIARHRHSRWPGCSGGLEGSEVVPFRVFNQRIYTAGYTQAMHALLYPLGPILLITNELSG